MKNEIFGDFPGGPVIRTLRAHCWGHGLDPWSVVRELRSHRLQCAIRKKKPNMRCYSSAEQGRVGLEVEVAN